MAAFQHSGEVVGTTSFISTLPQVEGREISRDNILQTLETMIDGRDIKSVHLEGASGSGKSILLAQFAKTRKDRAVSVFAKRSSWFTYDPGFLLHDLAAQMYWLIERKEPPFTEEITDATFRSLLYKLRTYSIRLGKPLVLILDGLAEIPEEQSDLKDLLISKLPLGLDYIKLLTSVSKSECGVSSGAKEWLVPAFSTEETLAYFDGKLSSDKARVIHATCGGAPGYLSGIRRLLDTGLTEEKLLSILPASLPDIFSLEWRSVDEADVHLIDALALLAHDSNKHSLSKLAIFSQTSVGNLRSSLSRLRFVSLPTIDSGDVDFVSEPFREFVAGKLSSLRDKITQRIIDKLSSDQDSIDSVALLPSYLKQAGHNRKLLQYLSPERFAKLIDSQHEISPVRQKITLGLETARELKSYSEMMRFAVQASALSEYSGFTASRSEIAARMQLQDEASCIALTQAAVLINDRLRLFAVIAKHKRERGESLQPDLLAEIESLFQRADWKEFDPSALNDLAADLVYVRPELATQALERATSQNKTGSMRLDFALASASMAAETSQDSTAKDNAQRLRAAIKNPRFLSMFNALASIMRGVDAAEIIDKVRELNAIKEQLYLLRQWSLHSRAKDGAYAVVSFALDIAIRATEYTPTATDFRELAESLRSLIDPQQIVDLIRRFDAQHASVEAVGPTTDYHYLQMLLALAEAKVDNTAAANRLVESYSSILQIKDLAVRTACLARLLDLLPLVDTEGKIRKREGLEELALQSFETSLDALLRSTADHTYATRDILAALVPRNVPLALKVALTLNVANRRDDALSWLVSALLRVQAEYLDLTNINKVIESFYDPDDAEVAVCEVLERIRNHDSEPINRSGLDQAILFLAGAALQFKDADRQVRACCAALLCLRHFNVTSSDRLKQSLQERMLSAWERLSLDEDKVSLGFTVSARFASADRDMADIWLKRAEECRSSHTISSSSDPYRHCLLLLSRSYMGLVLKRLDQREDLDVLNRLIARIPSLTEQLILWTDVALRILSCGKLTEAQAIVKDQLQKRLAHYQVDTCERYSALIITLPLLYHTSRVTAIGLMRELPPSWLNSAVAQTVNFIIKKKPAWDPFETKHHHVFALTIDEMFDLCDLAMRATVDTTIYWILSTVAASLQTKEAKRTITSNQRLDVISKLINIRDQRFPTPQFIQHMGYHILCSIEITQLERFSKDRWEAVLTQAVGIPNVADRCLVLAYLAGMLSKHDRNWATSILKDCESYAEEIPSALDRAQRLQTMAREAYDFDKVLAKELYTRALLMTASDTAPEYDDVRRDIIDSAHQVNPELATSIASAMDDDYARRAKRGVSSRIELLDLRRQLMEQRDETEELPPVAKRRLSEASWGLLGSLNSGRIVPLKIMLTRAYLEHAAALPFSSAFSIYSYTIENAIRRPQERAEEKRSLRGLYRSISVSADLFYFLAERSATSLPSQPPLLTEDSRSFCYVDPDQREKALNYIRQWLTSVEGQELVIHDPYLMPSDVGTILQMVLETKPELALTFITSKVGLQRARFVAPFADQFRSTWTETSSQSAPMTRIVVVAVGAEGDPLIHDRWWCCGKTGLDFGTSFNSLGVDKSTKIRVMPEDEAAQAMYRLRNIAAMTTRHTGDKRVVYESVDLE